jgi:hypothetical protein
MAWFIPLLSNSLDQAIEVCMGMIERREQDVKQLVCQDYLGR